MQYLDLIIVAIYSSTIGVVSNLLARDKGRNVAKWTIVGLIPVVNFVAIMYFIGASNLALDRKVDTILQRISTD